MLTQAASAQVIVTSFLFPGGQFSQLRLDSMVKMLGGDRQKLVIDLSCRRRGEGKWFVAMNKWQTITDMEVNEGQDMLSIVIQLVTGANRLFVLT
jgi:phosphoribosylformimino-5-aminoimidazole carboxamide ribotide isomerase